MKVEKFVNTYHRQCIEDWGSGVSDQFRKFARDFRSMARDMAKEIGAELVSFSSGHYDVSGFLSRNGHFCYFSYSVPRGNYPINCGARDCLQGILIRYARDAEDYRGGHNWFCSFLDFREMADKLLEENW